MPYRRTAVALGLFDGLHLGHQAVIHKAVDFIPLGISPAVFTFETDSVTSKGNGGVEVLLPRFLKHELLANMGVEYIYSPDFLNFKNLSCEEFVALVLCDKLKARFVICGDDFRFGRGGTGRRSDLVRLCGDYGIDVIVVAPVIIDDEIVSSTRIRQYIKNGEMEKANRLLGYDFRIKLPVIHGNEIGRSLGFPTINQQLYERQVVPKYGVYASRASIGGKLYHSITNIGVHPTIGGQLHPLAETHVLGFEGDLYGKVVRVSLHKFIRPEVKFASQEELQAQLQRDIATVKALKTL